MANRKRRTKKKDALFFSALATLMGVGEAAQQAGYSRSAVYQYREEDTAFAERWKQAIDQKIERLEREADRRAVEGFQCGEVHRYSDILLMFRLKALVPERYRERPNVQHSRDSSKEESPTVHFFLNESSND